MKSKWDISSQYINGKKEYQVYRKIDVNGVDHNGNREYAPGIYDNRELAEAKAEELNNKDAR